MNTPVTCRFTTLVLAWMVAVVASPFALSAQLPTPSDPGAAVRTREDLEELLSFYEDALLSPAYSEEVKSSLALEASRIRARLEEGDFKLGDRVALFIQGEPGYPDTVAVEAGPKISLGLLGDVSLEGVLRSEVEERIAQALVGVLRVPVVRAQGLMRVSVQGAVGQPGFYVVPADMLLSETLMVAGGPGQNAALDDLRLERGVEVLMEGDDLQEALRQGLSLDQLNMQAGDQVVLPGAPAGGTWGTVLTVVGLATSIAFMVSQLTR